MARQHKADKKPNFNKRNGAKSGGRAVKGGNGGNKYAHRSDKTRGPKDMSMRPEGNTGPCTHKCGHCVSCLIYKGDRANHERVRQATGW